MAPSHKSSIKRTIWTSNRIACPVTLKRFPLKGMSFRYMFRLANDIASTKGTKHRAEIVLEAGIAMPAPKTISKMPLA